MEKKVGALWQLLRECMASRRQNEDAGSNLACLRFAAAPAVPTLGLG